MGVWIMAGVTFREAARKKMLWMALAAGGAFLILFATGLHFQAKDFAAHGMSPVLRREISFAMVTVGLYAVDLLAVLMTILTSIDTVSGEIGDCDQACSTLASPTGQVVWLLRHADRLHCNHGGRGEHGHLHHGGCHCTSPR